MTHIPAPSLRECYSAFEWLRRFAARNHANRAGHHAGVMMHEVHRLLAGERKAREVQRLLIRERRAR